MLCGSCVVDIMNSNQDEAAGVEDNSGDLIHRCSRR